MVGETEGTGSAGCAEGLVSGEDFQHERMACPGCGKNLDSSLAVTGDSAPKDGDFTVCNYCAGIAQYQRGSLVKPDLTKLPTEFLKTLKATQTLVLKRGVNR